MYKRIVGLWTAFILSCSAIAVADQSEELPCNNSNPSGQGWSEACRQWFYHANQSSRLIHKTWLLALKTKEDSQQCFLSEVVKKYKYLSDALPDDQCTKLPIGFTVDCKDSVTEKCAPAQELVGIT